jgi:hypothetical protein
VRKWLLILAAATALALTLSTPVQASNRATVTRATLASFFCDFATCYPATCNEQQVVNGNHRKEAFRCTFDGDAPAPLVCDTAVGCSWFSDFDGAEAISTHFVITPSGHMRGWAAY